MKNEVLDIINSFPFREVSLGYRTLTLVSTEDLKEAQIGYSVDADGQSLVGINEGDWHSSWFVIADEDETGDPIFIDIDDDKYPVYTAMHGEGDWEPNKIAVSLKSFTLALSYIKELSVGRENPVALEKNPIALEEQKRILTLISEDNKNIDIEFWESWLEDF